MSSVKYEQLRDGSFQESFLMEVVLEEWPNDYTFFVWSPQDGTCYRIITRDVLEFHFMRTGIGRLEGASDGIPIANIYRTYGSDYDYWSGRVAAFAKQGCDVGEPPICIEFDSHLFANRRREMLRRNRDTGMLVVCRRFVIEPDYKYSGPWPSPVRIPSSD